LRKEGKLKKHSEVTIVDLPGIYSLSPYTPEEVVSRNFILEEHPDCVINVIVATNLERNLYMTTQILEMDVPVVIALNMADVLKNTGVEIDVEGLSKKLGVPVVSISALRQTNLDELIAVALKASEEKR
jgi:ferrous iron transport protein B